MDARNTSESPVTNWADSLTERVVASGVDRGEIERHLWLVVVFALVADVHLTHLGLQYGLTEGNPVARWAIAAGGIETLALGKVAVLGIAALVRWRHPQHGPVIPLGLAVPWLTAVALNAVTLA
ncbi:hypothetical protein SAMN05216559_2493 [Halomicrobium zhouii]|uniref:DUF5658 domain-containing protein n=1 Tax=Halomicrobium zhouii TaxID=767519 RepID=A0A1I6LD91_9EURY|nr:DUF5658 family protein [Halomicrobium zhouii]MCU4801148.1 DUF5658 family protein [Halobacteria archaeon HArc-gm2]SFS01403.1 hypothetical protein SAMN05216559_2493 [Halomicrobium zhouii]